MHLTVKISVGSNAMRNNPITLRLLLSHHLPLSTPPPLKPPNPAMARTRSTPPSSTTAPHPIKILMLHGYTQSGPLFHSKTRALAKHLTRLFPSISFSYPTAPHRLLSPDLPSAQTAHDASPAPPQEEAYGWWRRKDTPEGEVAYEGIEEGLARIAQAIREEGPFDGVVGFSQGGAAAAMVAALLEGKGRVAAFEDAEPEGGLPFPTSFLDGDAGMMVQAPLRFCVVYSGFRAPGASYKGFYEPGIEMRSLHFMGQLDTVVSEERSRALVGCFVGGGDADRGVGKVVVHPGGHFLPSQRPWLDAVAGFLKECLEEGGEEEKAEECVENMDVPFQGAGLW